MSFLPKGYTVPTEKNYMKFVTGENLFRILSNPIIGWEWWTDEENEKGETVRKPNRVRDQESVPVTAVDDEGRGVKHFWAFVVYNYQDKRIQILEIGQKSIQKAIQAFDRSKAWGDPKKYDISVTKEGEGKNSEYHVAPCPPKELTEEIKEQYAKRKIRLEALYEGENPFEDKEPDISGEELQLAKKAIKKEDSEKIDPEDIPF